MGQARRDLRLALEKRREYGSADLDVMASATRSGSQAEAIMFYALGKNARICGAYKEGREPSDDSYQDMSIYTMMARFTRDNAAW